MGDICRECSNVEVVTAMKTNRNIISIFGSLACLLLLGLLTVVASTYVTVGDLRVEIAKTNGSVSTLGATMDAVNNDLLVAISDLQKAVDKHRPFASTDDISSVDIPSF